MYDILLGGTMKRKESGYSSRAQPYDFDAFPLPPWSLEISIFCIYLCAFKFASSVHVESMKQGGAVFYCNRICINLVRQYRCLLFFM
mmetsp:Transcript_9763/g.16177  ORF Transcript_9763/g.16177 Transcript_9763/m.16177 type:complete len:87 (-) Transcript_9763:5-265(-)